MRSPDLRPVPPFWRAIAVVALSISGLTACSPAGDAPPGTPEAGSPGATAETAPPPQVVLLISIDTLRPDHLGFHGHERFTSPVLDGLAAQGVVFEDASSAAPWTLPAHASLLTGLFPMRHQVMTIKSRLADGVPTLASLFAQAGFETAAVVGSAWLRKESYQLTRDFQRYLLIDTPDDRVAPSTWVTDQATTWLRELGDRRLFLFVHYYDVHADYASLPEYERLFVTPYDGPADGSAWQLQAANFEPEYLAFCREHFDPTKCTFGGPQGPRQIDASVSKIYFDAADIRHLGELYDAGIRQLDSELGRLLSVVRQQGLEQRTLLLVTSDHGEEFGEHGRVDHFITQYQEMLHIPLILVGPGIPSGRRISAPASIVDLAPTLLSLAGAEPPAGLDGLDLSPLLSANADERPFRERLLYGEAAGGLSYDNIVKPGLFPTYHSVRRDRHKLVYESKANSRALYDLAADPREQKDISAAEPDVARELMAALEERRKVYPSEPSPENTVDLSPEDTARLRALGYIP